MNIELPIEIVNKIIEMQQYDNYWVYGLTGTGKSFSLHNTKKYEINKLSHGCNLELYGYIDSNTYIAFDDMDDKYTWKKILRRKYIKSLFLKNEIRYYDYHIDNEILNNSIIENMGKISYKKYNKIINPKIIITSYFPPDEKLLGKKWKKIIESRFEIIPVEEWLKKNNLELPNNSY